MSNFDTSGPDTLPFAPGADDHDLAALDLPAMRYGTIEVADGRVVRIRARRWPKFVSLLDVAVWGPRYHYHRRGDRCLLYFDQPRRFPNFLAVKYVLSTRGCTLRSLHAALAMLDEIARLRGTDALLCDAWNGRISDRLLRRHGWQPHAPARWHRNYIKRFYGAYPAPRAAVSSLLPLTPDP